MSSTITSIGGLPLVVEQATYFNAGSTFTGGHRVPAQVPGPARLFAEASEKLVDLGSGPVEFFDSFLLIGNDNDGPAAVTVRFLPDVPPAVTQGFSVPANSRLTVPIQSAVPAMVGRSFGMSVTSNLPISATRSQYFGAPPTFVGAHASEGIAAPSPTHLFAEGSTNLGFDVYYAIANSNLAPATATLTHRLETGATVVQTVTVPAEGRA